MKAPKGAIAIAACMLGCAAVSWLRFLVVGELASTHAPALIWPYATVGVLAAIAGLAHLRGAAGNTLANLPWRTLLLAAIAIHVAAALALPLTSNDVFSNLAYGRVALQGDNPFITGADALPAADAIRALVDPRWLSLTLPYGPIVAGVSMGAAATGPVVAELVAWKLVLLAAAITSIVLAAGYCRAHFTGAEARARFALFAWCPLFAWEISGQAHNDGVLLVALIGFVWAATAGREAIAVACLALGILSKFVAAPIAGLYLVYLLRRKPLRAIVLGIGLAVACVLVMLPFWHGPSTLTGLWTNMGPSTTHTSRSIADLLFWSAAPLGDHAQYLVFRAVALAGVALSVTLGVVGIVRATSPERVIRYALIFFLCGDLFGQPWFQPWYVTWLLPLALGLRDRRWLTLIATYAALSLASYILPIDPVPSVLIDGYIGWRLVALVRSAPIAADVTA